MATPDTEPWLVLGEAMRRMRTRAGHSLTAASRLIGRSKAHLSQVERGLERPSHEVVALYNDTFGADGLLSSLYLMARNPMLGGLPAARGAAEADAAADERQIVRPESYSEPTTNDSGDSSLFVADVTVPNGTLVPANTEILKIWRLRNIGTVPWIGRTLARVGPCDGAPLLSSPPSVPIRDTEPGCEVDIAVLLRTPSSTGTCVAMWKMLDGGRLVFPWLGDGLCALITVTAAPGPPTNTPPVR